MCVKTWFTKFCWQPIFCNIRIIFRTASFLQEWRTNTLGNIKNSVVSFLNLIENAANNLHPSSSYYPFDSFAVATVLNSEFVTNSTNLYCFVENKSDKLQGALAVDYNNITKHSANVELVMKVNATVLEQVLLDNLSNFS